MRHVTVVLYPDPELLHPIEPWLADKSSITRKTIHPVKELQDGPIALLAEVEGDLDRYREMKETSPLAYEFAISGDESGYCYSRVDSTPLTRDLMGPDRAPDFIVHMPIEDTADGGKRITLMGRETAIADALLDILVGVDMELESTGPLYTDSEGVFADLTDRETGGARSSNPTGILRNLASCDT